MQRGWWLDWLPMGRRRLLPQGGTGRTVQVGRRSGPKRPPPVVAVPGSRVHRACSSTPQLTTFGDALAPRGVLSATRCGRGVDVRTARSSRTNARRFTQARPSFGRRSWMPPRTEASAWSTSVGSVDRAEHVAAVPEMRQRAKAPGTRRWRCEVRPERRVGVCQLFGHRVVEPVGEQVFGGARANRRSRPARRPVRLAVHPDAARWSPPTRSGLAGRLNSRVGRR